MEEFYESDVMWPENQETPTAAAAGVWSGKAVSSSPGAAAPVDFPAAMRRARHGDEATRSWAGEVVVPPHLLVASRVGSGSRAAFSLCSGQGRTLKGRDLRVVRDSVLRMTGFIEREMDNCCD